MTDKEPIIIDGVDVSKCKYLPYCNDKQGNCAFEPNCYFKQLARKTQECNYLEKALDLANEQLKEVIKTTCYDCTSKVCEENRRLSNKLFNKIVECDDLKKLINKIEEEE